MVARSRRLGLVKMLAIEDALPTEAYNVSRVLPKFQLPWLSENQDLCFFYSKTSFATRVFTQNTLEIMTNPFMASKNHPKNRTQPETKNQHELGSIVSQTLKVQKHIICTPCIKWNNLIQKHRWNPATPPSLLSQPRIKKITKKKNLCQNEIGKILRNHKCIICVIV